MKGPFNTALNPQPVRTVLSGKTDTFPRGEAAVGTKPLCGWRQTRVCFLSGSVQ